MSKHISELRYTDTEHQHGVLYVPRNPAKYITFKVDRMLTQITFKYSGYAGYAENNLMMFLGAARRHLISTSGYSILTTNDAVMNPETRITVYRGKK